MNNLSIEQIQQDITKEFEMFSDWPERYDYLIEIGKSLPKLDVQHKTDNNLIEGCQSKVWLHAELRDNRVIFEADSDAIITKGIAGLLIRVFSNQTPDDIINANIDFIDTIGLKEHLSPTRANGLLAMIKQMKLFALALKIKMGK